MAHKSVFCLLITGRKVATDEQISLLYDQNEF